MRTRKAVVLLSAGLDSSVNLYQALAENYKIVTALTFDYGQRASLSEIASAKKICQKLNVPHQVIQLKWLGDLGGSSLTDINQTVPTKELVQINSLEVSTQTAKSVWVPNRNGVFLNIAAAYADSFQADYVIPGFNIEEAQTFPDNSKQYTEALNKAFMFSTKSKTTVKCFTLDMNKIEIVRLAYKLNVDFSHLWPCYFSDNLWCGQCESCLRAKNAFKVSFQNEPHFLETTLKPLFKEFL